jgi:flagellar assembly factor FliW
MKVLPDLYPSNPESTVANALTLPQGLIGFSQYRQAELLYVPDHLPFLWMKLSGPAGSVNFVVIEPAGVVPDYEIELFDLDAGALDLTDASQAMILNIVTLQPQSALAATVNLVGPIVVNRRTRIGRQLIIANNSRYSARHPLVQAQAACA